MVHTLFDIKPLLPLIARDCLILTPNNRLRHQIRLAYHAHLHSQTVASPRIYSLSEWQNLLWEALQNHGHPTSLCCLANSAQLDYLWQQVIAQSNTGGVESLTTFERCTVARQARAAHSHLLAWQQNIGALNCDPAITTWCEQFERALQDKNLITPEQQQQRLINAFANTVLMQEDNIVLHSFIDITPLSHALLQAASHTLTPLRNTPKQSIQMSRTSVDDPEQEIAAACQWARQVLTQDKEATVAIIAPQLTRDRGLIERHLTETFLQHWYDPKTPRAVMPVNISAAQTLADLPLINTTLQILHLNHNTVPVQQLIDILHSPFIGNRDQEIAQREFIVKQLKERATFTASLSSVAQFAQQFCQRQAGSNTHEQEHWQAFSKCLFNFIDLRRQQSALMLPSRWLDKFLQQLQSVGWSGTRTSDSVEYQLIDHWYILLEAFAAMDNLVGECDLSSALALLTSLAQNTPFQAETRSTPVQILGAFEAVGLQFSHCWVLGINDREWPAPLQPNPWLPKQLQAQLSMPHASLAREIDIAKHLVEHYRDCANQVIFSYAHQAGGWYTNVSPIIKDIEEKPLHALLNDCESQYGLFSVNWNRSQALTWVDCSHGPRLTTTAEQPAGGGQQLFKLQAQCPFNAFAQLRLHAEAFEPPTLGYGPREKGIIIHNALASIWQTLQNQSGLFALNDEELKTLIASTVTGCCTDIGKKDAQHLGDYYYTLEQNRIKQLLWQWLTWEKQRPGFTVIATEQNLRTEFAGVHMNLRIDRVDKLDNGDILLLDYKTSSASINTWMQDRPLEPQLPLYSLCYPTSPHAISFALINADEIGMRGVAKNSDAIQIDGIKPSKKLGAANWQELIDRFHRQLQLLAEEIIAGDCRVMFAKGYQASRDPLAPLNRIFEGDYMHYRRQQGT